MTLYDTLIVAGGPADLSAALHLVWHDRKALVIECVTPSGSQTINAARVVTADRPSPNLRQAQLAADGERSSDAVEVAVLRRFEIDPLVQPFPHRGRSGRGTG